MKFKDNKAALSNPDRYMVVHVDVARALESWRDSLFSFEWLDDKGHLKPMEALTEKDREKLDEVKDSLAQDEALEKPLLGLGLKDNVEIGSGKAVFMVVAASGETSLPVHIPRSNESDFKAFLADV